MDGAHQHEAGLYLINLRCTSWTSHRLPHSIPPFPRLPSRCSTVALMCSTFAGLAAGGPQRGVTVNISSKDTSVTRTRYSVF